MDLLWAHFDVVDVVDAASSVVATTLVWLLLSLPLLLLVLLLPLLHCCCCCVCCCFYHYGAAAVATRLVCCYSSWCCCCCCSHCCCSQYFLLKAFLFLLLLFSGLNSYYALFKINDIYTKPHLFNQHWWWLSKIHSLQNRVNSDHLEEKQGSNEWRLRDVIAPNIKALWWASVEGSELLTYENLLKNELMII